MLRVGLVGAGFMGGIHAAAWSQTPAQLTGILSLNPDQAQNLSQRYECSIYRDLEQMLADVDVIDVCTPTDTHYEIALRTAKAGKHIVCEKPLARTLSQGIQMLDACQNAGVQLLVAHVVRFFPEYFQAKSVVDDGDIGKVGVVRLTRCSFQPGMGTNSWLLDEARSGGVMMDLMIHDFDYARWVAGDVRTVYAKSVRSNNAQAKGDYSLAILQHSNGAISNVEGGWAYPSPLFRTAFEIAGDGGLIEHPAEQSTPLHVYLDQRGQGDTPDIAAPSSPLAEDPYTTQIKHFYAVLTGTVSTPIVNAEDGLEALRISLAALQSARTGRAVRMEDVQ